MNSEGKKQADKTTRKKTITGRKWQIMLVLVIAAAAMASLVAFRGPAAGTGEPGGFNTFTVRRDDLTVTVTESGSIKARKSIDLKSEVEGRATIISVVPEGTYITQEDVDNGRILCELDSGDLEERKVERQISLASAEADYAEAKEAYDIQLKQNESDITSAQLAVKFALMDFQKYLGEELAEIIIELADRAQDPNADIGQVVDLESLLSDANNTDGAAWQELGMLQDNIFLVGAKHKRADNQYTWTKRLYEKKYVSKMELDGDRLDVNSMEVQAKQAETDLELFRRYDFPKQTQKLLSDYYEAKRELDRTYARARSREAQAKARLESAEARLNLQQDRFNKITEQLAACTIRAPAPGLVVYGSSGDQYRRYRGGGIIDAGEEVYQRQTIIRLPDTSEMMAEISVHESSVDKVQPGQKATITMDAFPDRKFYGEVLKVAPLPDQQRGWLSPDIKVYNTEVSIEGKHNFLKPGMSAKVEILVDHLTDVLIAPVQVVANRSGKKMCYVVTGQRATERQVETGAFSDTYVQITEGLSEGEEVLMNPPRITESSENEQLAGSERADRFENVSGQNTQALPDRGTGRDSQTPRRAERADANDVAGDRQIEQFQNMSDEERARRMEEFRNMSDEERAERMRQFRERMGGGTRGGRSQQGQSAGRGE